MERGRRSDLERPTTGEELFDDLGLLLDGAAVAGFVPPAEVTTPLRITGGGWPSQPSGVLLSDQLLFSPLAGGTLVIDDDDDDDEAVGTFFAVLRKPKLIFGILLPNPPPVFEEVALALFESDMVLVLSVLLLLFVLVWRGEEEDEEREGQLVECLTLGSKGIPRKEMSFRPELL